MSKRETVSFVEHVLAGEALADDIDDFIETWHSSPAERRSLPEFLGLSDNEYALWVENPQALSWILMCKQQNIPFGDFDWDEAHQLAARANGPEESDRLIRWLKKTGRL